MLQTFGKEEKHKEARGEEKPVSLKDRIRLWLIKKIGLPDFWADERLAFHGEILASLCNIEAALQKHLTLLEEKISYLSEDVRKVGEAIPHAACHLCPDATPLKISDGHVEHLAVEAHSPDGLTHFVRPYNHPDIAECLRLGFLVKKHE